ncbi:hypothetical protein ACFVP3_07075 [Streptomyces sp. NPDC057806]|uniref:hypothetical protein n=1 Tax=unclassified Streptomyces TaxID=2593676 RepID=UPI0036B1C275
METDCTRDHVPAHSGPTPPAAGTRLLHIGPHKGAKKAMAAHGAGFPATSRHPMSAVPSAARWAGVAQHPGEWWSTTGTAAA